MGWSGALARAAGNREAGAPLLEVAIQGAAVSGEVEEQGEGAVDGV